MLLGDNQFTWMESKKNYKHKGQKGQSMHWANRTEPVWMAFSFFCDQTLAERSQIGVGGRSGRAGTFEGSQASPQSIKCLPQACGFLILNPGRPKDTFHPPASRLGMQRAAPRQGKPGWRAAAGPAAEQPEWWGAPSCGPASRCAGSQPTPESSSIASLCPVERSPT